MSEKLTIKMEFDLTELFTEFLPKAGMEALGFAGMGGELEGTEMTLVMEVSGNKYSYTAKNGVVEEAREGDMEAPKVRVKMTLEDMENLIVLKNAYMFFGLPKENIGQAKEKQAIFDDIRGTLGLELTNDDDSVSRIEVVMNNAAEPKAVIKTTMESVRQMISGENNPVSLFMSGGLQIEGDIGFAMGLQPLMM